MTDEFQNFKFNNLPWYIDLTYTETEVTFTNLFLDVSISYPYEIKLGRSSFGALTIISRLYNKFLDDIPSKVVETNSELPPEAARIYRGLVSFMQDRAKKHRYMRVCVVLDRTENTIRSYDGISGLVLNTYSMAEIFNNGPEFIIEDDETIRTMVSVGVLV